MKLDALQIEIRPRSIGQTIAIAVRLLQARPLPILVAWFVSAVGICFLGFALLYGFPISPSVAWMILILTATPFCSPVTVVVGHLVFSPRLTWARVQHALLKRLPQYLVLFGLMRVATLCSLVVAIVPGLFLWRRFWFLAPIAFLEGASLRATARRVFRFGTSYDSPLTQFGLTCFMMLIYWTVTVASLVHFVLIKIVGLNVASIAQWAELDAFYHACLLAGVAVAFPFVQLFWFFVYLDIRARNEGWDLEIAFRGSKNGGPVWSGSEHANNV